MQDAYTYTMHLITEHASCMYKVTNPRPMHKNYFENLFPTVVQGPFFSDMHEQIYMPVTSIYKSDILSYTFWKGVIK